MRFSQTWALLQSALFVITGSPKFYGCLVLALSVPCYRFVVLCECLISSFLPWSCLAAYRGISCPCAAAKTAASIYPRRSSYFRPCVRPSAPTCALQLLEGGWLMVFRISICACLCLCLCLLVLFLAVSLSGLAFVFVSSLSLSYCSCFVFVFWF